MVRRKKNEIPFQIVIPKRHRTVECRNFNGSLFDGKWEPFLAIQYIRYTVVYGTARASRTVLGIKFKQ